MDIATITDTTHKNGEVGIHASLIASLSFPTATKNLFIHGINIYMKYAKRNNIFLPFSFLNEFIPSENNVFL